MFPTSSWYSNNSLGERISPPSAQATAIWTQARSRWFRWMRTGATHCVDAGSSADFRCTFLVVLLLAVFFVVFFATFFAVFFVVFFAVVVVFAVFLAVALVACSTLGLATPWSVCTVDAAPESG